VAKTEGRHGGSDESELSRLSPPGKVLGGAPIPRGALQELCVTPTSGEGLSQACECDVSLGDRFERVAYRLDGRSQRFGEGT
jgi:hypothetical protein